MLLFYPIIPSISLIALLWVRPRDDLEDEVQTQRSRLNRISTALSMKGQQSISNEFRFREMEYLVTVAHAIAGGVESPLQLTFQVLKNSFRSLVALAY